MHHTFSDMTFCIRTFGCQMNKHDSERIAGMLEGLGALQVETSEEADMVVFMTCCVREAADVRLMGQVASLKNLPLREGAAIGRRIIAVGGCIGQRDGEKLTRELPHLDVVFGTHNLGSLPKLMERAIGGEGHQIEVLDSAETFPNDLPTAREHSWAAWLPITIGCNNFCSYCIVPYVRGREKSRSLEDVVAEAKAYVDAGVKEITLLGQNVNSYGRDLYGAPPLRRSARCDRRDGHSAPAVCDEPSEGSDRRRHRVVRHASLAHAGAPSARPIRFRSNPRSHEQALYEGSLP